MVCPPRVVSCAAVACCANVSSSCAGLEAPVPGGGSEAHALPQCGDEFGKGVLSVAAVGPSSSIGGGLALRRINAPAGMKHSVVAIVISQ